MTERRLLLISEQATEILRLRAENEELKRLNGNCDLHIKEVHAAYALEFVWLKIQIKKLREALKPFADIAGYYDVEPDDQPAWDNDFQPTVGELRAAAAALKETGDEKL